MTLWEFGRSAEAASRALLLAEGLRAGPAGSAPNKPAPWCWPKYRICGVGLFARSANQVVPCIYVEQPGSILELVAQPVTQFPGVLDALGQVFGPLPWRNTIFGAAVSSTMIQADAGDYVKGAVAGQLGCSVTWGGKKGFLTAGHVGGAVKTRANDAAGNRIGTVVFSLNPPVGASSAGVDVAVIELPTGVMPANKLGIKTAAVPGPNAAVDVYTRTGPIAAQIYGANHWWYASQPGITYTEVYLSNSGVTTGGDSGGPVLLSGKPGEIIGHIVCGGTATSCFQDVAHQLQAIGNDPAFCGIAI